MIELRTMVYGLVGFCEMTFKLSNGNKTKIHSSLDGPCWEQGALCAPVAWPSLEALCFPPVTQGIWSKILRANEEVLVPPVGLGS